MKKLSAFEQRAQQQQDQQQLQLRQHNISHNPVYPEQVMSPKRPNVEVVPGPEALYQQNNLLQQVVHLGMRSGIERLGTNHWRIKQCIWTDEDAQNQRQGMASFHEQLADVHRKSGISEREAQAATGRLP